VEPIDTIVMPGSTQLPSRTGNSFFARAAQTTMSAFAMASCGVVVGSTDRSPVARKCSAKRAQFAGVGLNIARENPNDPAFIVYTSGTTGHPKGALVAHGKHLAATANLVEHYPTLAQKPHRTVAYLPLCHVLGRDVAVTLPLISRLVPHFGESPEDLATTLFETAPTVSSDASSKECDQV